jgi:hypothetical protein
MIQKVFVLLLLLAVFLQGSVTTIPLPFILLVVLYCFYQSDWVFLSAFLSGIFLDILLVQTVGMSSIFFVVSLFLIFLYQRKFEIASYYFVFFALLIGSGLYSLIFGIQNGIGIALLTAGMGIFCFWCLRRNMPRRKTEFYRLR